jgi:hypothetical protein
MAAYSSGNPVNSATASSGYIEITISDNGGGGGNAGVVVDLLVAVQNASYQFTGGGIGFPATSTFGNNGARWDRITVSPSQSAQRIYNWTRSVPVASTYMVVLLGDDGAVDTVFGTISGISNP